jgi:hypothetical protein
VDAAGGNGKGFADLEDIRPEHISEKEFLCVILSETKDLSSIQVHATNDGGILRFASARVTRASAQNDNVLGFSPVCYLACRRAK